MCDPTAIQMPRLLLVLLLLACFAPASAQPSSSLFELQAVGDAAEQGVATLWNDIDDDGDVDLLVINVSGTHTLFVDDGSGGLTAEPFALSGVNVGDGVFADLDADGDDDLLVGSLAASRYYRNDDGTFNLDTLPGFSGIGDVRHVDPVDLNGDGLLDVFLSLRDGSNRVLRQVPNGQWAALPVASPGGSDSTNMPCWADLDRDGDLDAFVVNSAGSPNAAYRNDEGTLVLRRIGAEGDGSVSSTSCDWGDADGDGDLDLLVTSVGPVPVRLYRNDRADRARDPEHGELVRLTEADDALPLVSDEVIAAAWVDVENDGDLDVVTTARVGPSRLFLNDGTGSFTQSPIDGASASPSYRTGLSPFDVDGDGDLDLAVGAGFNFTSEPSFVLSNTSTPARWLGVQLLGQGGNLAGIGARVTVYATLDGSPRTFVCDVLARQNRLGQSPRSAHVGLGADGVVDSVRVDWPSGAVSLVESPQANGVLAITEPDSTPVDASPAIDAGQVPLAVAVAPNPSVRGVARVDVTLEAPQATTLVVYDALGREVWVRRAELAAGRSSVSLPTLASGTYLVRVRAADGALAMQTFTVLR